ncbi:hypothetical protein M885DRAFT_507487 [Pelagophyceae sp. CCMP2097]|nr:hypothetical protein M885DRAFT_507487 [Pelagophyceae sp. CCMP2097]
MSEVSRAVRLSRAVRVPAEDVGVRLRGALVGARGALRAAPEGRAPEGVRAYEDGAAVDVGLRARVAVVLQSCVVRLLQSRVEHLLQSRVERLLVKVQDLLRARLCSGEEEVWRVDARVGKGPRRDLQVSRGEEVHFAPRRFCRRLEELRRVEIGSRKGPY